MYAEVSCGISAGGCLHISFNKLALSDYAWHDHTQVILK